MTIQEMIEKRLEELKGKLKYESPTTQKAHDINIRISELVALQHSIKYGGDTL